MKPTWLLVLTLAAALGSGLIGGVFFAFSTFVMNALSRLPAEQGIAAMQSINIVVINALFMLAFLGTAADCVALGIAAFPRWGQPAAIYLLAGSLLYFVGTFLVTMVCNVPLNDTLAVVKTENAAEMWKQYLVTWTFWNHVRTIMGLAASGAFILALMKFSAASNN